MRISIKYFHRILVIVAWGLLSVSLIHFLIVWDTLPKELGVHFGPDGQFDFYGSKKYGFYPYIAGFVMLFVFEGLNFAGQRVKLGIKVKEAGEGRIRNFLLLYLDILKLGLSIWMTQWSYCVINQIPANVNVVRALVILLLLGFVAMIWCIRREMARAGCVR